MRGEKLRGQKEKLLKTDTLRTCEETGRKKIKGIKTNKQTNTTTTKRLQRGFRARLPFPRPHSCKGIKETQNSVAAGFHENESSN